MYLTYIYRFPQIFAN